MKKSKKEIVKEEERVIKMANQKKLYKATLIDISVEEIRDGYLKFDCDYLLSNRYEDERIFSDSFDGDHFNYKANAFFGFLKKNQIKYVDYDELIGLAFMAELHVDSRYNKVLIPTKLIAPPLMMR